MTFSLTVTSPDKTVSWSRSFNSSDEFDQAGFAEWRDDRSVYDHNWRILGDNQEKYGLYDAVLYPVRTDTIAHFCTDFFLPITMNREWDFQPTFLAILSIAGLFFDLITFPIRAFTAIPRVIHNTQKEHPLRNYLKSHGVPQEIYAASKVEVQIVNEQWCLMPLPGTGIPTDAHRTRNLTCEIPLDPSARDEIFRSNPGGEQVFYLCRKSVGDYA